MKHENRHPSGGKLRPLFCLGLTAVLAAGVALNSMAANLPATAYDVEVSSSSTHTAALSSETLYLWGTNEEGQFPNSDLLFSPEPVELLTGVKDAAVSDSRTLVVEKSGSLRSYGMDPLTEQRASERGTLLAKDAVQVAASDTFAAYISKDGALYTWGRNECGQLGTGTQEPSEQPIKIFDSGVKKVSLGSTFGLALLEDGTAYGWGLDSSYQFGYTEDEGPVRFMTSPVQIAEGVQDIATGDAHSCLLKTDGSLWTCGDNTYSQTGVGSQSLSSGLTQVLTGIRSISAGSEHNFAISNDGAVYAWGYGLFGQLGDGSGNRVETPTETALDYVQVFACRDNTFGVSSDGSIYSFGGNTNYRLGKSNGSDSLRPMRILDQEMNWVYTDTVDDDHDHGTESSGPENLPPESSGTESKPVENPDMVPSTPSEPEGPAEPEQPELVSVPFASGYGDGSFRPDRSVTRAEFLKMLVVALCDDFDPDANYGTCSFSDIPLGKWYENYIAYAEQNKLVEGYQDGTFHPEAPITRAEAAKMAASILNLDTEAAPDAGYSDVKPEDWAAPFINALTQNGAVGGDGNGTFRPGSEITRAEAAKMTAVASGFRPNEDEAKELAASISESPFHDVGTGSWYYVYLLRSAGYIK